MKLGGRERYEERKWIITSMIRLISECDFSKETLRVMYGTAEKLKRLDDIGETVSDDALFLYFEQQALIDAGLMEEYEWD